MKRSFLLTIAIILSLVAVTGTLAYFTDQVQANGIVASGNISILQHEYERVKDANGAYTADRKPYTQGQVIYPGSDIDKIVEVENNGKNVAYVRTFVAVPAYYAADGTSANWITLTKNTDAPEWEWAAEPIHNVLIDGITYDVYYATNVNPLTPGAATAASMLGYHVDEKVDYNGTNYTYPLSDGSEVSLASERELMILVSTEAAQAHPDVFTNAYEALKVSYGGEPAADRHPWQKVVLVKSNAELEAALKDAKYDTHIGLKDGSYTLPANLPNGIRLMAMGLNVELTLADTLYAYDVEIDGVTITNKMVFTGNGSFQEVTFNEGWAVTQPDGDVQFDSCIYDSAEVDAGEHIVTQTNNTKKDGTPIVP